VAWGPQPFALVVRGALGDCPAPASPAAPLVTAPADGQLLVSWDAVPGTAAYNVYRSFGACPGGGWIPVAQGITDTSFLDATVSGGVTYSYHVTAGSDAGAFCESPPSPCASALATGACTLAPDFSGVTAASSDGLGTCSVTLSWPPATPFCGTDVRYNIYRHTDPAFVPGPGSRIARCVAGTSFTDGIDLVHDTDYYYLVRAEDATSGHGGPCRGGNEDTNATIVAAAPLGPPGLGTWADDAGDTDTAKLVPGPSWSVQPGGGNAGPAVYQGNSSAGICTDLTTPVLTLGGPGDGPQLFFSTIHNLEYDWDLFGSGSVGQVEIATGPDFTDWTRVALVPDYPTTLLFDFTYCTTTPAGLTYFTGPNLTYTTYSASLVNWGNEEIRLRFHISGDTLLAPGGSWWVDDVLVAQAIVGGSCATATAGPPPIPDGASVPGMPMQVASSGDDVQVTWDTAECGATAVNIYTGGLDDFTAFTGGFCDLPGSGSATLPIAAGTWFLVTATDGASTEGSWSRDGQGNELTYTGASAVCPAITEHVDSHTCP
jgi:hypothetical protein